MLTVYKKFMKKGREPRVRILNEWLLSPYTCATKSLSVFFTTRADAVCGHILCYWKSFEGCPYVNWFVQFAIPLSANGAKENSERLHGKSPMLKNYIYCTTLEVFCY